MTRLYTTEKAAKKAAREIGAMWPDHKFTTYCPGFRGYVVSLVRDGKPCEAQKLKPLPFTVTATGTCVVFQAVGIHGNTYTFPTHRKALNKLRAIRGRHVSPVEFVGPLQPHVQRRVAYLAQQQRNTF